MEIFIFASKTHTAVSALTSDQTGISLPQDYAPWRPVNSGRALPVGAQSKSIVEEVERCGFFLLSSKTVRNSQ